MKPSILISKFATLLKELCMIYETKKSCLFLIGCFVQQEGRRSFLTAHEAEVTLLGISSLTDIIQSQEWKERNA